MLFDVVLSRSGEGAANNIVLGVLVLGPQRGTICGVELKRELMALKTAGT